MNALVPPCTASHRGAAFSGGPYDYGRHSTHYCQPTLVLLRCNATWLCGALLNLCPVALLFVGRIACRCVVVATTTCCISCCVDTSGLLWHWRCIQLQNIMLCQNVPVKDRPAWCYLCVVPLGIVPHQRIARVWCLPPRYVVLAAAAAAAVGIGTA